MTFHPKFLHLVFPFAAAALFFGGCTATVPVRIDQPFYLDDEAALHLRGRERLPVAKARIESDSLVFVDAYTGRRSSQPLDAVEKLRVTRRGKGALQGLGIGPVLGFTGGLIGASIATAADPCRSECFFSPTFIVIGSGIFWSLAGLALGPPVGALIGARQDYVFESRQSETDRAMPAEPGIKPETSAADSAGE